MTVTDTGLGKWRVDTGDGGEYSVVCSESGGMCRLTVTEREAGECISSPVMLLDIITGMLVRSEYSLPGSWSWSVTKTTASVEIVHSGMHNLLLKLIPTLATEYRRKARVRSLPDLLRELLHRGETRRSLSFAMGVSYHRVLSLINGFQGAITAPVAAKLQDHVRKHHPDLSTDTARIVQDCKDRLKGLFYKGGK